MFKPLKMVKIGIVTPNNQLSKVIDSLYSMRVLQIEEHEKSEELGIGEPLKYGEELSELLVKIKSIASNTNINILNTEFTKKDLKKETISSEVNKIYNDLKNRIEKVEFYKKIAPLIKPKKYHSLITETKIDSVRVSDKESAFFCGFISKDISKELNELSKTSFIATKELDSQRLVLILAPIVKKEEVSELLKLNNFVSIDKDEIRKLVPNIKAQYNELNIKTDNLQKELIKEEKAYKLRLVEIKDQYENFIINANYNLEAEHEKCEAPLKFAASKNTHIISGYVPMKSYAKVKETLERITDNKIFINIINLKENETAPVMLKNPKPSRSFQFLLDLFATPIYKEIDPTFLMFITFPLFFGFMLGDIGYGLITLVIFLLMRLKFNKGAIKQILNILILSSIGTIIFGFVFGEFFGEEYLPIIHLELPHLLSRVHQISELLALAIVIGIVHVAFGLILGFINVWALHGVKHAIYEKVGWLLLIPLVNWLLLNFLKIIPGVYATILGYTIPPIPVLIIITLIGIFLIFKSEGTQGLIELPSIFSNILSYARLMAVGLASAELALIINEKAGLLFHKGGFMIVFGILILLIGHLINLVLGLFGPFVHSLRLHYVEFFKRFYIGGGKKFVAFGEKYKSD